ncbi:lipoprotein [Microbacterium sp. SUBG005]|nr:lipoprotein [Microbacterium sp. SUBG005]
MTTETMVRTQIVIDDASFYLAQGQDLHDLERRIEAAVHTGGRFERFVVVGNREMCVLFTPHTRVAMAVETVLFDPRDTGDPGVPFGGFFDE